MSSPRRLVAPECDVQWLQVSSNVSLDGASLRGQHATTRSKRSLKAARLVPRWSVRRLEAARSSISRAVSRSWPGVSPLAIEGRSAARRLLGFGATPCRLVSLIHTSVGPYGRARDVRNASDMKVNRMSLALAAVGQRAAMASELAGFGRNFRAGMHSMVSKNLAFKSWRL